MKKCLGCMGRQRYKERMSRKRLNEVFDEEMGLKLTGTSVN